MSFLSDIAHAAAAPAHLFTAVTGVDPTPGFNIDAQPGGGIPFVSKGNGSTGIAPATSSTPKNTTLNQSGSTSNSGSTTPTTYSGAGSGPTTQDAAAYNTYKGEANTALGNLLNQYNTSINKENSAYNQQTNADQSAYNQQKANYDNQVTGQNQGLIRQTNQDEEGVSNAYNNLMNLLGAYGGGASSVAMQWAPQAANTYQNKLLSGDKETTASNLASLANNWDAYNSQYQQKKQQDLDTHNNNLAQAKADYNQTKTQLNGILNDINTQALDPSDVGTKLDDIQASIPNNVFVQPTYTGLSATYTAPSLDSFESTMPTASVSPNSIPNNSSATPALYYLMSQQQQKQNQNQPVTA